MNSPLPKNLKGEKEGGEYTKSEVYDEHLCAGTNNAPTALYDSGNEATYTPAGYVLYEFKKLLHGWVLTTRLNTSS